MPVLKTLENMLLRVLKGVHWCIKSSRSAKIVPTGPQNTTYMNIKWMLRIINKIEFSDFQATCTVD